MPTGKGLPPPGKSAKAVEVSDEDLLGPRKPKLVKKQGGAIPAGERGIADADL